MLNSTDNTSQQLPQPVLASTPHTTKKATFDTGLRVHWARFKKRIGNGSSAISESLLEGGETTTESSGRRFTQMPMAFLGGGGPGDNDEVDEIVVDNTFLMDGTKSVTQASEPGMTPEKTATGTHGTHGTDRDSFTQDTEGFMDRSVFLSALRYRFWPVVHHFFFIKFHDPAVEAHYQKEVYYQGKSIRIWGCLFFILNWVLVCILINKETMIILDKCFYWGICPLLCVPLPLFVIFDWPRSRPWVWQAFMTISIWSWATYLLILAQLCGTWDPKEAVIVCPGKDFIGVFYYTSAVPVIGLFALGQNRLAALSGAAVAAGLIGCTIRNRQTWIRNLLNFCLYIFFLLWVHYQRETAERRLYTLRDQLKIQYRATQKAQVSERKAADSKKRFSSYIFHEVRVPLNTALLAVQNMEAQGVFHKENIEFTALEGSLSMMSKVLNDVLDFNRMDSGRFESIAKPYAFHKVIKGILVPLRLAAGARELDLVTELDPMIDVMARRALYLARGESEEWMEKQLHVENGENVDMDNGDGLVVGDEHRLRQIVTNLASNACKFTPSGGRIFVRTKLIYPASTSSTSGASTTRASQSPGDGDDPPADGQRGTSLSATQLSIHNAADKPPLDTIVIRLEVEDTGVGIRRKEMIDNKLFSPYVQTDIGRFQGGKGTGLGLALSKHIVRLSGGRLGVKSKLGVGSTFWVELAVGVGPKVLGKSDLEFKEGLLAASMAMARTTTEAFKAPEGEGATPSTMMSSIMTGQEMSDHCQAPPSAMRQLMEHSGQIEILPRMAHRLGDSSIISGGTNGSLDPAQLDSSSNLIPTAPPSPTNKRSPAAGDSAWSSATLRQPRAPLPRQQGSYMTTSSAGSPNNPSGFSPPSAGTTNSAAVVTPASPPFDPPLSALVVDDDFLTRKLMSRMLARLGCIVETAENGQMALEMILPSSESKEEPLASGITPARRQYDVIFLDNQMPQLSGVELVKQLRDQQCEDFVVGVTGNALKEDQREYTDAGVDHVLTKPVLERSIKSMLQVADERRRRPPVRKPSS